MWYSSLYIYIHCVLNVHDDLECYRRHEKGISWQNSMEKKTNVHTYYI